MKKEKTAPMSLRLFLVFFKIGLCTFGGGYAMIALLETELVGRRKWLSAREMQDAVILAQAAPGVIAINTATFTGKKIGGFWGAVASVFGVCLPAFLVISILQFFLEQFRNNSYVSAAFEGVQYGIVVLILGVALRMLRENPHRIYPVSVTLLSASAVFLFGVSPVWVLLAALVSGLTVYYWQNRKGRQS